jgi:hypothetical protein
MISSSLYAKCKNTVCLPLIVFVSTVLHCRGTNYWTCDQHGKYIKTPAQAISWCQFRRCWTILNMVKHNLTLSVPALQICRAPNIAQVANVRYLQRLVNLRLVTLISVLCLYSAQCVNTESIIMGSCVICGLRTRNLGPKNTLYRHECISVISLDYAM